MADWTDEASATTEFFEKVALDNLKHQRRLTAKGRCYNCDEGLHKDELFCDGDCRDDWQREQDAKARNRK